MSTLPALKESNITQVLDTIVAAQNALTVGMAKDSANVNTRFTSFKSIIGALLKFSENNGFFTGIHLMVGPNMPDRYVYADKKWNDWPKPAPGTELQDFDTMSALLLLRFSKLTQIYLGVTPVKAGADEENDRSVLYNTSKTSGRIPSMIGKDRQAAAALFEKGIQSIFSGDGDLSLAELFNTLKSDPVLDRISKEINENLERGVDKNGNEYVRPSKACLNSLVKSFSEKKQVAASHLIVEALKRMLQLRFMMGVIKGIHYASPKSCEGLTIVPSKGKNFTCTFENFAEKMEKIISSSGFEQICSDKINEFRAVKKHASSM